MTNIIGTENMRLLVTAQSIWEWSALSRSARTRQSSPGERDGNGVALLAPIGLTALAALALPLLIHLVRRIELRTTVFAALRWISERIRPRRRLRFERPWLLLLRLALLGLLALLLARPVINEPTIAKPAWVLVAPGADLGAARAAVSIAGADWRWLAPGFPAIETPSASGSVPTASLLREIDADLPRDAQLAIVVPEQVAGLDGERPRLARTYEWHVVPGRMPAAPAPPQRDTVELSVRYAPSAESHVAYVRAAITALNARASGRYELDAQAEDVPLAATARELVWLGSAPPPAIMAWIEAAAPRLSTPRLSNSGRRPRARRSGAMPMAMCSRACRRSAMAGSSRSRPRFLPTRFRACSTPTFRSICSICCKARRRHRRRRPPMRCGRRRHQPRQNIRRRLHPSSRWIHGSLF